MRVWFGIALALCAGAGHAQLDEFPRYNAAPQVVVACDRMLAALSTQAKALHRQRPDTALLVALDTLQQTSEDTLGPLSLLAAVHPSKPIRDAAEACDLRFQAFSRRFEQDPAVFALLKQVKPADAIDARLLNDQLDAFEDAGVALPADAQARAQQIDAELSRLAQDFERTIRENKTRVGFSAAELSGVPSSVWKGAKRDRQGRYLLGLDYPTAMPVIEKADRAATRERMWRAMSTLGGEPNLVLLTRIGQLRRDYARLFGLDAYADFALRRRMAGNAANVQAFLGSVKDAVRQREVGDLAVLREAKARQLNQPVETTTLHRWDLAYYTERARQARYGIDQEEFRAYFPPEASLNFVFKLAEQLFGVRFAARPQPLWHADAKSFQVSDVASGQLLGTLFVDLYPRADKFNHAAVWPVRSASTRVHRLPAAALVVNFNRQGLTIEELETLLHEFGHALHALLATTRYAAGNNVLLDYVEAPSQMLEDWVYDAGTLALFQQVCAACKPVPASLLAQADKARRFDQGIAIARQHLYASYDLAVYGHDAPEPMALWARMEGETPVGFEPGSMFPASFSHITEGYSAGYYGYLWSLVLAEDLRTAFDGHRLDPAVGRRYRDTVLANGGQVAPADLIQQFLGRPTDSRAFFKALAAP